MKNPIIPITRYGKAIFDGLMKKSNNDNPFVSQRWGDGGATARADNFGTTSAQISAYEKLPWAAIAIDAVIRDTCSQEIYFTDKNNQEIDASKLPEEITLPFEMDYEGISFHEKMELMVGHLLLGGNAFLWRTASTAYGASNRMADTFVPLLLPWVKPCISPNKLRLHGYNVTLPAGEVMPIEREEMVHFRQNIMFSLFWGVGNITKARLTAEGEVAAQEYAIEFMEKKASPSMIISEATIRTQADMERMGQMLKSKWEGKKAAGSIMYLSGQDVKAIPVGMNYKDLQFIEKAAFDRQTMLSVFGVMPDVVGITENSNRAVGDSQWEGYYKSTCNPLLVRLANFLNRQHVHLFDKRVFVHFRKHATGNVDTTIKKMQNGLISPNRASELVGEASDVNDPTREGFYIGAGFVPLGTVPMTADPATPEDKPAGDDEQDVEKRLKDPRNVDFICEWFKKSATRPKQFQVKYLRAALKSRNAVEEKYVGTISTYFEGQKERVLQKLKEANISKSTKDYPTVEFFFNINDESEMLKAVMNPLYTSGVQRGIGDINNAANSRVNSATSNPFVKAAISRLGSRITGTTDRAGNNISISKSTQRDLASIMEKAVNESWHLSKIQDEIQGKFDEWQGYRARRIARTESRAAWDAGSYVAYQEIGVKTVDIIGCNVPIDEWPCGAMEVPLAELPSLDFHPNHQGTPAPSFEP